MLDLMMGGTAFESIDKGVILDCIETIVDQNKHNLLEVNSVYILSELSAAANELFESLRIIRYGHIQGSDELDRKYLKFNSSCMGSNVGLVFNFDLIDSEPGVAFLKETISIYDMTKFAFIPTIGLYLNRTLTQDEKPNLLAPRVDILYVVQDYPRINL